MSHPLSFLSLGLAHVQISIAVVVNISIAILHGTATSPTCMILLFKKAVLLICGHVHVTHISRFATRE